MPGCDEQSRISIHTAGLLHDIGKFIFPDSDPARRPKLDDADWEIVKLHPEQGAKLVRQDRGLRPRRRHHPAITRRIDGTGYPAASRRRRSRCGSRIIAAADTYDG